GSVLAKLRPPAKDCLPYVALPYKTKEGAGGPPQPGFFGGFLGQVYDPFWVLTSPNEPSFSLPELTLQSGISFERLCSRSRLLKDLEAQFTNRYREPGMQAVTRFHERALDLLTSADAQKAFRIQEEPDKVREAYGRNIYGQSVLLARRLIESGTRAVPIAWPPAAHASCS